MKMPASFLCIVCSVLPWLSACEKEEYPFTSDFFYVKNEGAEMPVWIRGNTDSNTFILWLHGGPGGSSLNTVGREPYFRNVLEPKYGVVYYDQRASGNAQGNIEESSLTISQFVEDLDKVVEVIRSKHPQAKIFLAGHSWGAILGTTYLLQPENQQKITAWIEIDGLHNLQDVWQFRRRFVIDRAKAFIEQGESQSKWKPILDWCQANAAIETPEQRGQLYRYMIEAGGRNTYRKENGYSEAQLGGIYDEPNHRNTIHKNRKNTETAFNEEINNINLTSQLPRLTLPSLILWGKLDGVLPTELADSAYEALGTPEGRKHKFIFDKSGHYPMIDQPDLFVQELAQFVDQYN
jgi:pimeloyl-ACP methyl ester carboxylesterase